MSDHNIKVLHQKNAGVTAARKAGVNISVGEYITFVDSDDWIHCDMYRIMLAQKPADIYICNINVHAEDGSYEMNCLVEAGCYEKQKLNELIYPKMLFDYAHCVPGICPSMCNKLFRREIICNVIKRVDVSITYGEDALCTYACMLEAERILFVDQVLYDYRKHPLSVCNLYSDQRFQRMITLGTALEIMFAEHSFDAIDQLSGYLARPSLELIRKEILFHSDVSYREKRKIILQYLKNPMIARSFRYAIPKIKQPMTKLKMQLCANKMIGFLHVLFKGRHILLRRNLREN